MKVLGMTDALTLPILSPSVALLAVSSFSHQQRRPSILRRTSALAITMTGF